MTSAENSVSEPPNLKIFWGRIPDPPTRFVPSALQIMPPPPPPARITKNLATALLSRVFVWLEKGSRFRFCVDVHGWN